MIVKMCNGSKIRTSTEEGIPLRLCRATPVGGITMKSNFLRATCFSIAFLNSFPAFAAKTDNELLDDLRSATASLAQLRRNFPKSSEYLLIRGRLSLAGWYSSIRGSAYIRLIRIRAVIPQLLASVTRKLSQSAAPICPREQCLLYGRHDGRCDGGSAVQGEGEG